MGILFAVRRKASVLPDKKAGFILNNFPVVWKPVFAQFTGLQ